MIFGPRAARAALPIAVQLASRLLALGACFVAGEGVAAQPLATAEQLNAQFFMAKINVSDLQRSIDFYTKIIGLKEVGRIESPALVEVKLTRTGELADSTLVLMSRKSRTEKLVVGNGFANLVFIVRNVEGIAKRISKAGYEIGEVKQSRPPSYATPIEVAYAKDPDGFVVELVQYGP